MAYFAASTDPADVNRDFAKSLELDYPILSDPTKEVARSYGVLLPERGMAQRWTFYIDKNGKIAHIDKGVKAASHGADIVAKLRELGVAEKGSGAAK